MKRIPIVFQFVGLRQRATISHSSCIRIYSRRLDIGCRVPKSNFNGYSYIFLIIFLLIPHTLFTSNQLKRDIDFEKISLINSQGWRGELVKELENLPKIHDVRGKISLFLSDLYIKGLDDIEKNNEKAEEFNEKAMSRSLRWAMILYFEKGKSDKKYTEYTQYLKLYGGLERIEQRLELLFQGILENKIELISEAIVESENVMNNYIQIFPSSGDGDFEATPFFKVVRNPFLFYERLEEPESEFLQILCALFKFGKKPSPKVIDPILETDIPDICKILSSSLCFVPVSRITYKNHPWIQWEEYGNKYLKFPFQCFDMEMCLYLIQKQPYASFTRKAIKFSNRMMKTFYESTLKESGEIELLDLQREHFEQALETFSESKKKTFLENEEFGDVKYDLVDYKTIQKGNNLDFSFARISSFRY